ncbi:MAG: AAA family ATPase, partial [Halomonadaceae bacterium]
MQTTTLPPQSQSQAPLNTGLNSLAALWVARVLLHAGGLRRFILSARGFYDTEVVYLLDLGHLAKGVHEDGEMEAVVRKRCQEIDSQPADSGIPLTQNILRLGDQLGLNENECQILAFMAVYELFVELKESLESVLPRYRGQLPRLLALVLNLRPEAVDKALARDGKLSNAGLIEKGTKYRLMGRLDELELLDGLADTLAGEFGQVDSLFENYFSKSSPATLNIADFAHVSTEVARLTRLLTGPQSSQRRGVNILLYGAPGVGKTELVKTLASSLGRPLYEVGSADEDGDSVAGEKRFRCLRLCQYLLADNQDALILFDEVEDVLSPILARASLRRQSGKAWTNKQMENASVPTFWLSNNVFGMDPAHLRRFDYVLNLTPPPRETRVRMFTQAC